MRILAPYSGGLLRLALMTIGFVAVFAAALEYWQGNFAGRTAGRSDEMDAPASP